MAKILINYVYNKTTDKYEIQKLPYVFADMKVAVLETEEEINEPLVVPINNVLTVVDRAKYQSINRKFYLVADENGKISEQEGGAEIWLPKDTDLSKLKYINGRLVLVENEEKKEEKPKKKTTKKEA